MPKRRKQKQWGLVYEQVHASEKIPQGATRHTEVWPLITRSTLFLSWQYHVPDFIQLMVYVLPLSFICIFIPMTIWVTYLYSTSAPHWCFFLRLICLTRLIAMSQPRVQTSGDFHSLIQQDFSLTNRQSLVTYRMVAIYMCLFF